MKPKLYVRHEIHRDYGIGEVIRRVGPMYAIVEWEGVHASSFVPWVNLIPAKKEG